MYKKQPVSLPNPPTKYLAAYLESIVLESISKTSLGLIPTASFHENGKGRRGSVVIHGSDLDAAAFHSGSKGPRYYALDVAHSSSCQHLERGGRRVSNKVF
jgi:hypothetical protein